MTVIVLSTSENLHADEIQSRVLMDGIPVVRMNADAFVGSENVPHVTFEEDGALCIGDDFILLRSVMGVFVHHPRITLPEIAGMDDLDRRLCIASWRNMLGWLEHLTPQALWINQPSIMAHTASSPRQFATAMSAGFRVPDSCFTNCITSLQRFATRHTDIIMKPGNLEGVHMKGSRILTQLIHPDEIDPSVLQTSPCLFQEYIPKKYELRVHVLNGQVYACKIESQRCEKTKVDWRNYAVAQTPHYPIQLGVTLEEMCCQVVEKLGLAFGVLDLVVTPTDDVVFLECNSQGYWIWIEELTGLPITNMVCRALMRDI